MSDFELYMKGWRAAVNGLVPTDEASRAALAGYAAGKEALAKAIEDADEWQHNAECEADDRRVMEGDSDE